jgi:hypothetical protein
LKIGIWNLKSDKKFWILVYFIDMQWRNKTKGKYCWHLYESNIFFFDP